MGTSEANSAITVLIDGTESGGTTQYYTGGWIHIPNPLPDGIHSVQARATDAAGNSSPLSNTVTFTVATVAPTATVVTPPNGAITNINTPTITGTIEAHTELAGFEVLIDGTAVGVPTMNGSGNWFFQVSNPLPDGIHAVQARPTDAAGNSGVSNTNTFTVDTVAPAAPIVTAPANGAITNNNTPTITGTAEANSTITVLIDSAPVLITTNGSGSWTLVSRPLADGTHAVQARATDTAGNSSVSNTNAFTVDTVAPAAPIVTTPTNGAMINNNTPTITGTAEANSVITVLIDGAPVPITTNSSGSWSVVSNPLPDGIHAVQARATDAAGNSSLSNTNTFTVDTVAPAPPVVTTPANGAVTNARTLTITGTAEANSAITVLIDGTPLGGTTTNGSGNWFLLSNSVAEGSHAVQARATDTAGNSSLSNTNTLTVDLTPPSLSVLIPSTSPAITNNNTPLIAGTAYDSSISTITVLIDDGAPVPVTMNNGSWSFVSNPLQDGIHDYLVTATDEAGNQNSRRNRLTVDTVAPSAPIVTTPANGSTTNNHTPLITGTAEVNSAITVLIDGTPVGGTSTNGGDNWSFQVLSALSDGLHSVRARAIDEAGNASGDSNTNTFNVATTPTPTPTSPPTLDPLPDRVMLERTVLYVYPVAHDTPGDNLTFSLVGTVPAGLELAPDSGTIFWLPLADQGPGTYPVTLRVTDSGGLFDQKSFTITVKDIDPSDPGRLVLDPNHPTPPFVKQGGQALLESPTTLTFRDTSANDFVNLVASYPAALNATDLVATFQVKQGCQPEAGVPDPRCSQPGYRFWDFAPDGADAGF